MTVSYRPTQNSQEPEPRRQGVQQTQNPVAPITRPVSFNEASMPRQVREVQPGAAGGSNGSREQKGQADDGAGWSSSLLRDVSIQATRKQGATPQEIENGNIILYRRPNFILRTVYRPAQKQHPLRKPTGNTTVMPKVMPHQETRIAASETRIMPNVKLNNAKQTKAIPLPTWLEAVILILSLTLTFVIHAYNLFNFPRYELDEGTYISNAWAITQGLISPYPYGYGHPPLAWIQIAAWLQLTGGPFTFGNALNSGRVLMLFYAVGSALLVYLIVRRWSGSRSAALLALIIFSLSPLSITYQRQIYLDNVATFWLLLSLYFLAVGNSRLLYIVLAAISFGISVLSKEIMLLFLPVMLYAVWLHTTKFQRKFSFVSFTYIVIAVCSGFVLLAALKDELFPYAWHLPWDTHVHLSMLDTFVGQAQRGQSNGSFTTSWATWLAGDLFFIVCSIAAPFFNLVNGLWSRRRLLLYVLLSLPPFSFFNRAFRQKLKSRDSQRVADRHLLISLLAISYWLLLVRGGQVLSFYIVPLIPLTAMNVAAAFNTILGWPGKLMRFDVVRAALLVIVIMAIIPFDIQAIGFRFYQQPTSAQQQALVWVRSHVPRNSFIVVNSYLYLDLRVPGGQGVGDGAPFAHAEVYWNVSGDPQLHKQALDNNPDRIDYIVTDSEMLHDIQNSGGNMSIINDALKNAVLREEFRADDHNLQVVVQVWQVIHKTPPSNVYTIPASGVAKHNSIVEG